MIAGALQFGNVRRSSFCTTGTGLDEMEVDLTLGRFTRLVVVSCAMPVVSGGDAIQRWFRKQREVEDEEKGSRQAEIAETLRLLA